MKCRAFFATITIAFGSFAAALGIRKGLPVAPVTPEQALTEVNAALREYSEALEALNGKRIGMAMDRHAKAVKQFNAVAKFNSYGILEARV